MTLVRIHRRFASVLALVVLISLSAPWAAVCFPGAPAAMPCCHKAQQPETPTARACCGPAESVPATPRASATPNAVAAPQVSVASFQQPAVSGITRRPAIVSRTAHVDIRLLHSVFLI